MIYEKEAFTKEKLNFTYIFLNKFYSNTYFKIFIQMDLSKTYHIFISIKWMLLISILLSTLGCSKDGDNDEYYIKYEAGSSTIYTGGKLDIVLTNEKNLTTTLKINTKSKWETIVGPVKKGFKATIQLDEAGNNYGHLKLSTQISVSKNNGPFALKAIDDSDDPRTSVQLGYTVDFGTVKDFVSGKSKLRK